MSSMKGSDMYMRRNVNAEDSGWVKRPSLFRKSGSVLKGEKESQGRWGEANNRELGCRDGLKQAAL